MKRIILLTGILSGATCLLAQKGKVTEALNYLDSRKYNIAVALIEEATDSTRPGTATSFFWPMTWVARGKIYQGIWNSNDENLRIQYPDALTFAFESYMRALELDKEKSVVKKLMNYMVLLVGDLTIKAVNDFKDQKFDKSLTSFEQVMAIENHPVYRSGSHGVPMDTAVIFNAGNAAYYSQQYDKAIAYYQAAAQMSYNGADTYLLMAEASMQKQEPVSALQALREGLNIYPGDNRLIVRMINIYLHMNKADDAMKYVDYSIAQFPLEASYYFARGLLYENLRKPGEAQLSYQQAIALKNEFFEPWYNLGVIYYNKGVTQVDIANAVPAGQPEKYQEEKNKADAEFMKAIPCMEKAHAINPSDISTMETLKTMYRRFNMNEKYAATVRKINNLQ